MGWRHGVALVHVIKKGARVDHKHVGTAGSQRDDSDTLRPEKKESRHQ